MAMSRRTSYVRLRLVYAVTALLFLVSIGLWNQPHVTGTWSVARDHGPQPISAASNETLGFQAILALSSRHGWRIRGLESAARLTGLIIDVPVLPRNPQEMIDMFAGIKDFDSQTPSPGSATAWLSHLDMLKYVIFNQFQTALIIEDDVDWDLEIRRQMPQIAENVRNYTYTSPTDTHPYGGLWDVLWIGHCGERSNEADTKHLDFEDPTVIPGHLYNGWSKPFWIENIPFGHRRIQSAVQPVCSFGYAVTKSSAPKVLWYTGSGADEAFDVKLSRQCIDGNLRCIVVNPEVMHHYEAPSAAGYVSPVREADGKGVSKPEEAFEHIKGDTANIVNSARCRALFDETCLAFPS